MIDRPVSQARPYAVTEQLPSGEWLATVHIPHDPRTPIRSPPLASVGAAGDWAADLLREVAEWKR